MPPQSGGIKCDLFWKHKVQFSKEQQKRGIVPSFTHSFLEVDTYLGTVDIFLGTEGATRETSQNCILHSQRQDWTLG